MSHKSSKLIYVLPNLFTAGSIFVGIVSIFESVAKNFELASWLILLSLILDGLDGRVARITKTESQFGAEFDSLADIVAFGVAPSMLLYFSFGYQFDRVGVLISALFVVFGAIRLARFNVMISEVESSVFIGIPIPAAAVFLTTWVLMFDKYHFGATAMLMIFASVVAILMVSNIRYPSFKKFDLGKGKTTKALILLTIMFSLLYVAPIEGITAIMSIYVLFGLLRASMIPFKKIKFLRKIVKSSIIYSKSSKRR